MSSTSELSALHHLFSPTTLSRDLSYVDKTYYESTLPRASRSSLPGDNLYRASIQNLLFDRTLSLFSSISRLDLRNVGLFTVPNQIACLSQLSVLDLSYNRLETVPCPIFELKELKHLDLSHNRIIHLPTTLGNNFSKLTFLDLSTNPLEEIPVSLAQLARLTWLDLSHTAIDALPAELLRLRQTTIKCDHCPALEKRLESFEHSLVNDVPSLAEFCCRQLVILQATTSRPVKRKKRSIFRRRSPPTPGPSFLPLHEYRLPSGLGRYLAIQPQPCSFCGRPYFENPVIRYRLVQRNDETWVPVKYQLCSAHWGSETDRILAFFATGSNYRNDSWLASVSAKPE